jgi:hypothetical protein
MSDEDKAKAEKEDRELAANRMVKAVLEELHQKHKGDATRRNPVAGQGNCCRCSITSTPLRPRARHRATQGEGEAGGAGRETCGCERCSFYTFEKRRQHGTPRRSARHPPAGPRRGGALRRKISADTRSSAQSEHSRRRLARSVIRCWPQEALPGNCQPTLRRSRRFANGR